MFNSARLKVWFLSLCLTILCIGWLGSCAPSSYVLNVYAWNLRADAKKEALTISHEGLGLVMENVNLALREKENLSCLSKWKLKTDEDSLIITTQEPLSTTWTFKAAEDKLIMSCSAENAFLQGMALASEERIPARIEAQDNGIMYTSIGFVSAQNIHCLFDLQTNTLIQFPPTSQLIRNLSDEKVMDVTFPVTEATELILVPDYYTSILGLKFYEPRPKHYSKAPVGWCSWYCYYMGTTEDNMADETDALAKYLRPYGLEYVQLDACFTRGEDANYLEWTKETFPNGGKWVFEYIKSKGLKPGLWVNIYGSNYARAECADKYSEDFYLRDKEGKLSSACCTADDTVVRLDYSNPEVIEKHLKPMFRILKDEWGLQYLKDAGWGTWMDYYDRNIENAFDPSKGSRELYVRAQKALRETLGPDVYILGCAMHEVGLGFGIFDGSRIGGDDKAVWYPEKEMGMSMQTYFHSLFGGNYLNNIVWHCDPDTVMVRNPLTLDEARTIVSAIALTGQVYMASDFMAKLPPSRLDLYRKTMPSTPIIPIDLYPFRIQSKRKEGVVWCCPRVKEFPSALDLKVNAEAGIYDVVAVFNWDDHQQSKTISLRDDLGLATKKPYLVFDFWEQKLKEISTDKITSFIPAHGTSVYVIRPVLERPQLLATSRHITGTVSIKKCDWDASRSTLIGISKIVPGAPYSLFIHVPDGISVSNVESDAEILFHKTSAGVLEVKFAGEPGPGSENIIHWSVHF